jgi:hypothetical protein
MFPEATSQILYKYRPIELSGPVERLLQSGELRFSCAREFNDPFDTAITYVFDGVNEPIAEKWAVAAAKRHMPLKSDSERAAFVAERLRRIRQDPRETTKMRSESIEADYDRFGICSLAGRRDDLLMWAHYASGHAGVCIGIDLQQVWRYANNLAAANECLDFLKVRYCDEMPRINFFEAMLDEEDTEHIMEFVRVKSSHWSYEEEHRIVFHGHTNEVIQFGPALVSEVVLGCKIDPAQRLEILSLCRRHIGHARLFDAVRDERTFRLNIVPLA